jgi:methylenetetrahydrofolate dehydrogenase (NADP+)/methenyltetrahydrofolate cyclohydrolase
MVIVLDGKKLADELTHKLMGKFRGVGGLAAVQVGENPASELYLKKKGGMAEKLGVRFELHKLPAKSTAKQVISLIDKLNGDKKITGIIVQLPLPKTLDVDEIVNAVSPLKDVDGLTDANILSGRVLPATAAGILKLLGAYKISLQNRQIVLVGFTRLLNLPLSLYLAKLGNQVTVLQEGTKNFDRLKTADIVITAVGKPDLIKGKDIRTGAVVIDAGIVTTKGKVTGDCDAVTVSKKAGYLTPVPGGVGPMTVVSLLANLLELSKKTI